MNYTEKYSVSDEKGIHKTHKHWIIFALPIFISIPTVPLIIAGLNFNPTISLNYAIFLVIFWAPSLISRFLTELVLTNKRISGKKGFISIEAMDSPLDKINNVRIKQTILGRVLNYGTIELDTTSGRYLFKRMSRPSVFKKFTTESIEIHKEETMKKQADLIAESLR